MEYLSGKTREVPFAEQLEVLSFVVLPPTVPIAGVIKSFLNLSWARQRSHRLNSVGAPMPIQKELMRHASIQTTMNVYGRATMSVEKRAANSNVVQMALRPTLGAKREKSLAAPG